MYMSVWIRKHVNQVPSLVRKLEVNEYSFINSQNRQYVYWKTVPFLLIILNFHIMSTLELTILMGGFTYLSQQHLSSFTKLKDPKRLLQYGQCNFPLVQDPWSMASINISGTFSGIMYEQSDSSAWHPTSVALCFTSWCALNKIESPLKRDLQQCLHLTSMIQRQRISKCMQY